ncbi:hypothetical protein [Stakelama saccharophila]|uniref:Cell division protein FtsL n=1 Tax=Stakelama saccharophila TaxID=3075605 RepID=A0ABZ0B7B9_9SPHN|nr:hypothetical protein [Stakelama sp. W311]WNO53117.1 hypothetical protein RPR59_11745 [Stakelama sp. W311]
MMAVYGFKGIGWIMSCMIFAPGCYLVTSQVAAERARVESVDRAIRDAQRDIRDLNIELRTRASMAQLEQWNSDVLALSAPRPDQYLASGAQGVAQLDAGQFGQGEPQYVAYVMPGAGDVAPAGATHGDGVDHSGAAPAVALASADTDGPAPARMIKAVAAPDRSRAADNPHEQKVAMLDEKLLSESTLGDIARRARIEAAVLR